MGVRDHLPNEADSFPFTCHHSVTIMGCLREARRKLEIEILNMLSTCASFLLYFAFDLAQPLFLGSELQNVIAPSILHGLP